MGRSISQVLHAAHRAETPVWVQSNTTATTMDTRADGGLNQRCLGSWPALLLRLLGGPALLLWLLRGPTLLMRLLLLRLLLRLLPWLGLRGLLSRCRCRCRLWLGWRSTLSQGATNGRNWFWQRSGFFCGRRSDEFRERDNSITVGVGLGVKRSSLIEVGTGGLSQLLDVQGPTAITISRNEMFRCTDEFRFIIRFYSR